MNDVLSFESRPRLPHVVKRIVDEMLSRAESRSRNLTAFWRRVQAPFSGAEVEHLVPSVCVA